MARGNRTGLYFGIPLALWVIAFLVAGLVTGVLLPRNRVATALYTTGTYFPKTVVTLAALFIFALLAAATAKLVLFHRERAGRLFGVLLALYIALGVVSLLYVAAWIPILTRLPFTLRGVAMPGPGQWIRQLGHTFSGVLMEQPLIQVLLSGMAIGYFTATIRPLRPVASGLIRSGDLTLLLFKKLLWYYPIMIGCLAIGIPMKFGLRGMGLYGQTVLWVALVTMTLSVLMIVFAKTATNRTWKQLLSYYGSVWPTGFGTGGSYDTLPVNIVSAEQDLGLPPEVAEVSIVFGTVLNKSCSSMAVLLGTISVTRLLHIPISLLEVLLLIPPVLILGFETPGIPGGAAFFMSPIVAVILKAPDVTAFVTTFVIVYSGLIPMLTTGGNTTNDGIVGALLNDRFSSYLRLSLVKEVSLPADSLEASAGGPGPAARLVAWILLAGGAWMLISPQAILGLDQLKWTYKYAFPGEALVGVAVFSLGLYILRVKGRLVGSGRPLADPVQSVSGGQMRAGDSSGR